MRVYPLMLLAGFAACGTVESTRVNYKVVDSISFRFEDERPIEERLTARTSSVAGRTTLMGDDSISPSGPMLLRSKLGEALSEEISGAKVLLSEFSVQIFEPAAQINEQAFQSAANSVPGAGIAGVLLGRLFVGGIEAVKSEKTVRVRISGAVDAVRFGASTYGTFKGRVTEDNINSVILKALDETVGNIKEELAKHRATSEAGVKQDSTSPLPTNDTNSAP
jgi:hypothetical protein